MIDLNKSNLYDQQEIEVGYESLSAFFRIKSEELQAKIEKGSMKLYPQQEIANLLKISKDQLQQKLYRKKPITREWLIAICAAYGLDDADTSEALSICDMATLDDASKRERFIVDFLRTHKYRPVGVDEFNQELKDAGLNPLDISYRKNGKLTSQTIDHSFPYKEIRPRVVRTYEDQGDPYNSLATIYLPGMRCVAAAFLENDTGKKYLLEAYSDGDYLVREDGEIFPKVYKELKSHNEFYRIFIELSGMVKKRKQELDNVIKDSKNYKGRFSANVKNERIHVFYEEYNYSMPERNEYYLMEYNNGEYVLSVAHESMFMLEYLSNEDYLLHYGRVPKIQRNSFSSIDKIEEFYENKQLSFYPDLKTTRKAVYNRLKEVVENKLNMIRSGELHIQNFDYVWDIPEDVLAYYKVEDKFQCTHDNEYGVIKVTVDDALFKGPNGDDVLISFDDIKEAFELGIATIEDICRIKQKYGALNVILET